MKPFSLDALSEVLHRHLGDAGAVAPPPPPPSPQVISKDAFDRLALRGMSDGEVQVETRLLEALLRTNLSDAQEIAVHVASGAYAEAASVAHKIKGAARMVDAKRVILACEALERAWDHSEFGAPGSSLAPLAEALDEFNQAIQVQLAELASAAEPRPPLPQDR